MTNDEIQTEIAEECGWYQIEKGQWLGLSGLCRDKNDYNRESLPDYPNDLNAMHEAEKVLSNNDCVSGDESSRTHYFNNIEKNSTALVRAIQFLRIKGKWKE